MNAGPQLLIHAHPRAGKGRPVGEAIVERLFPEGDRANSRGGGDRNRRDGDGPTGGGHADGCGVRPRFDVRGGGLGFRVENRAPQPGDLPRGAGDAFPP